MLFPASHPPSPGGSPLTHPGSASHDHEHANDGRQHSAHEERDHSTSPPPSEYCVYVRELQRKYDKTLVLKDVSMTLPKGQIYGLLGPSGCGKTTFLKCLLGRLKAHGGSVHIFGQVPGSRGCEVPGRDVGYMPQGTTQDRKNTGCTMHLANGRSYQPNRKLPDTLLPCCGSGHGCVSRYCSIRGVLHSSELSVLC